MVGYEIDAAGVVHVVDAALDGTEGANAMPIRVAVASGVRTGDSRVNF